MSGGHFNYDQYKIGYIADEIEHLIINNNSEELDEWGYKKHCSFEENTIEEFKRALRVLRMAQIYAQRIDWLVSGDDGEDSFHRRLNQELFGNSEEDNPDADYDVVVDTLQKHHDTLWNMSKNKEQWGIMDFIRLDQMDELKKAIKVWQERPDE